MKLIKKEIVFDAAVARADQKFAWFDSLVKLSDRSLVYAFKLGSAKLSHNDNLLVIKSTDQGMTWTLFHSAFSSVYNNVKGSLDSGYITELKPGHLINILFVGRQDGSSKPLLNPETTGLLPMKCLLAQLYDSGASWSQFRELDLLPQTGASPNCEILRLQDGTLLCTLRKLEKWDGHPKGVWLGNNRVLLVYYAGDNN